MVHAASSLVRRHLLSGRAVRNLLLVATLAMLGLALSALAP